MEHAAAQARNSADCMAGVLGKIDDRYEGFMSSSRLSHERMAKMTIGCGFVVCRCEMESPPWME